VFVVVLTSKSKSNVPPVHAAVQPVTVYPAGQVVPIYVATGTAVGLEFET
jgi:hypothetical protein